MTRAVCIYHAGCADGFAAAWAVRTALGDEIEFFPAAYGDNPPPVAGADVIMVDFSYKRPVIEAIAGVARSVLILDHHKTAESELAGFPAPAPTWQEHIRRKYLGSVFAAFDMERSGAQMAWDFFCADARPALIEYVGDRDLWRFQLRRSREVHAALMSYPMDFETWEKLAEILDDPHACGDLIAEGAAILRKHDKDVDALISATRRPMWIGGQKVPVANVPYFFASDVAGAMAKDAPFAATYMDRADGRVFSLRSRGEAGADVAEIAARYGGGGHKNAAGFSMPVGWEGDPAPMRLMRATKAGGCRSGADGSHGAVIHLVEIPEGAPDAYMAEGPALCGTSPAIMWSDWAPEGGKVCTRCARKAEKVGAKA